MSDETAGCVTISFAETASQMQDVFQLRYAVFHRELERQKYADTSQGIYADGIDGTTARILVATDPAGTIIGTLRCSLGRDGAFLAEDELAFRPLLASTHRNHVALVDRGAIDPGYRGRSVYHALWDFLEEWCRKAGVLTLLGVIDANNAKLCAFHQRRGWTTYCERVDEGDGWWNYIVKAL